MNCTGFGLLTAIPALVAFSVLKGRTQRLINDINETSVVGAEPDRDQPGQVQERDRPASVRRRRASSRSGPHGWDARLVGTGRVGRLS